MRGKILLMSALAAMAMTGCRTKSAAELGERYWQTKDEGDRRAWIEALDREGHDFSKRYKVDYGPRGIYKFNLESRLASFVITKAIAEKLGRDTFDKTTPDGPVHFEWTRRDDGSVDYRCSAPTNWEVFVRAYGDKSQKNPIAEANVNYLTRLSTERSLELLLMHHRKEWKIAGPYKDYPFPTNEIAAANNFSYALYEAFKLLGFDRDGSVPDGRIWLATFYSNFPNGHTDFPPHFHIGITCRDGSQTHHFYVRPENGRVSADCYQDMSKVIDVWDRAVEFKPGDEFPAYDGRGRVVFRVTLLKDESGLEICTPDRDRRVRVSSPTPTKFVDVSVRAEGRWSCVRRISVADDPHAGVMLTPDGEVRYDPMTGKRLKEKTSR